MPKCSECFFYTLSVTNKEELCTHWNTFPSCSTEREDEENDCGPAAKLFEPKAERHRTE